MPPDFASGSYALEELAPHLEALTTIRGVDRTPCVSRKAQDEEAPKLGAEVLQGRWGQTLESTPDP